MINSLSRVKICVPIRAKSLGELIRLAKKAREKGAKYIEIWWDSLVGMRLLDLQNLRFLHPYIFVCKGKKEHGEFQGSEEKRLDMLLAASWFGADFVDVSIETDAVLLKKLLLRVRPKTKVILSYHNFKNTPSLEALMKICEKGFALGADIVKIATQIQKHSDNVILFELTARMKTQKKKVIVVGMGEKGTFARIGGVILGGFLTYVALDERKKTASGQLSF